MKKEYYFITAIGILALVLGFGVYKYSVISKNFEKLTADFEISEKNLADEKEAKDYILGKLSEEQSRNSEFAKIIGEITSTVGTLDKLSKTDKELLQKYSKVYFLNEHYVPEHLSDVSKDWVEESRRKNTIQVHTSVAPFLERMLQAAKDSGNEINIISGYRSFGEQSALKNGYTVTYGSGANTFSADQGYSEHQLGTTFDFTTPELGSNFTAFEKTEAYQWLLDHAYEYGFVLSYPKGNAYYQFEPWHWRFVGTKLALRLHNEGENFYDVDQRTIDNYLITIFD